MWRDEITELGSWQNALERQGNKNRTGLVAEKSTVEFLFISLLKLELNLGSLEDGDHRPNTLHSSIF